MKRFNKNKAAAELEKIIAEGLQDIPIPYKKGNSIRIGHMVVRKNKFGYLVLDIKNQNQIATTQFKTSAVAMAKTFPAEPHRINTILKIDRELTKHYNDAMFYKHTINSTDDSIKRCAAECRLDLSLEFTRKCKKELDSYIFRNDK